MANHFFSHRRGWGYHTLCRRFNGYHGTKQAEKVLLDDHQRLENKVTTSKEELEKIKVEAEQVNTALNVLLKLRETDKAVTQIAFADEIEATVLPLIKKMRTTSAGRLQTIRLTNILETNLQQLVKSYGHAANLAAAYKKLTPMERQVAVDDKARDPQQGYRCGLKCNNWNYQRPP